MREKGTVLSSRIEVMTDQMREHKIIRDMIPLLAAFMIFAVMFQLGIYRCPLDFLVGIPCPLCGMTRAFVALVGGDVAGAFYYHPLWPLALPAVAFFVLNYLGMIHPPEKVFGAVLCCVCVLLAVCFVIRHIMHSPVVALHFPTSLAGRILSYLAD